MPSTYKCIWILLISGFTQNFFGQDIILSDSFSVYVEVVSAEYNPLVPNTTAEADRLALYLNRIFGDLVPNQSPFSRNSKVKVVTTPSQGIPISIHVGYTSFVNNMDLSSFRLEDEDQFEIKTIDNLPQKKHIIILGKRTFKGGKFIHESTKYGVSYFLETYLGVRWLMPSMDGTGEHVPSDFNIRIQKPNINIEAAFLSRKYNLDAFLNTSPSGIVCGQSDMEYFNKTYIAPWFELHGSRNRIEIAHGMNKLFPINDSCSSKYYPTLPFTSDGLKDGLTEHPDCHRLSYRETCALPDPPIMIGNCEALPPENNCFANEAPYKPTDSNDHTWQPKFSVTDLELPLSVIQTDLNSNSWRQSYSLSINDGIYFDVNDLPKSREKKRNYLGLPHCSNAYFTWANRMASALAKPPNSDLMLGALAYINVVEPPDSPIHLNIKPFIAHDLMKEIPEIEPGRTLLEAWSEKANELGWYDYPFDNPYLVPRIALDTMSKQLILLRDNNVKYYYPETHHNYANTPKTYILMKLLWNPDLDPYALLRDWCFKAVDPYSPLANETGRGFKLYQYYKFWSDFWDQKIPSSQWLIRSNSTYLPYGNPAYMDELSWDDLVTAETLLEGIRDMDSRIKRRSNYNQFPEIYRGDDIYKSNRFYLLSVENWLLQREIYQPIPLISRANDLLDHLIAIDGERARDVDSLACDPIYQMRKKDFHYQNLPSLAQFEYHNLWGLFDKVAEDSRSDSPLGMLDKLNVLSGDPDKSASLTNDAKAMHSILTGNVTLLNPDPADHSFERGSFLSSKWSYWSRSRGMNPCMDSQLDTSENYRGKKSFKVTKELSPVSVINSIYKPDTGGSIFTGSGLYAVQGYVKIPAAQASDPNKTSGRTVTLILEHIGERDGRINVVFESQSKEITPRGLGWFPIGISAQFNPTLLQSNQTTYIRFRISVEGFECEEAVYLDDFKFYRID